MIFLQLLIFGTISGSIGSAFPLFKIFNSSPLEVLRDG